MNNLHQAIRAIKLSEQSCREEASGKLDDSHNLAEGMAAIETNLKEVRRFLSQLAKRKPMFLTAEQRRTLKNLTAPIPHFVSYD